ncbi:LLM class flavin-dependent oxidoreductase [Amycolatopsis sp. NPDC059021]|uniref:LLM class flavin-dependent oxidoreductase n=1 Tax=Amycolatopsis sp. NPDC059021 TaxID=3346704 RepID=UPI00366E3E6C
MDVGITFTGRAFGPEGVGDVVADARFAEAVGLESVWVGDHLIAAGRPMLDSMTVLTTAAAATNRLKIGYGVMILALRPVAWVAKQIATQQLLTGGRVLLGVGAGGNIHGDAGWRAVGKDYARRGALTDAALAVLPDLIAGRESTVDGEPVRLEPGAEVPPILVGGGGAALRRAAQYGDAWYPAISTTSGIAAELPRLAELAERFGRPVPSVTVGVSLGLGALPASVIDRQVRGLADYGLSEADARAAIVTGTPAAAAEVFAELRAIGVSRIVGMPFGGDWRKQAELLAEAARLV